jgi:exodeoxyribonuclease V alpha subunit
MSTLRERDPFDARLARIAPAPLEEFNDAGVLTAADIQVARRLGALAGEGEPVALLALALAVRAPRLGHVLVDLMTIRATVAVDTEERVDLGVLPWPDPDSWLQALAASLLVATDDGDAGERRPLRLVGSRLYLERYWREERDVAAELRARGVAAGGADPTALEPALERLFPDPRSTSQRAAAAAAATRCLSVIAGGPGTGKTSTVARIAALVFEQGPGADGRPPLIALAAPTGKAAARLAEAVHEQASDMAVDEAVREQLLALGASTLHRLLGVKPRSRTRFRHDRRSRLPHDVVIVDEASMMSLTLTARLLEAIRPDARLVLVGDPGQLASVEAGAVLGDVVLAAGSNGDALPAVSVLQEEFRYGQAISRVARAVRTGYPDAAVQALRDAPADTVTWIDADPADPATPLGAVHDAAVAAGREMIAAAREGRRRDALRALAGFRLVCGHRRGPYGVSAWMPRVEGWLADEIDLAGGRGRHYPGRPLLVTANDYDLELFNGDAGVIVTASDGSLQAAFERRGQIDDVPPGRLAAIETVFAMTVHKSQGSQFGTAVVIVPPSGSRLLTRELLYTAVTRAQSRLIVVGREAAIRAAVRRPAARASGLTEALSDR